MRSKTEEVVLEVATDVYAGLRGWARRERLPPGNGIRVRLRDISYKVEDTAEVLYKNKQRVGTRRLDFVVVAESDLVIELKAKSKIEPKDRAQLRAYLRTVGQQSGLLINFPHDDADTVEHEPIRV